MIKRRWSLFVFSLVGLVVGVGSAMRLGSTWADVVLQVSSTVGLAFLVFWLEDQWSRKATEMESRTDAKIDAATQALTAQIDEVRASAAEASRVYVATKQNADRALIDEYLANPTSDGYLKLLDRVVELGLDPAPTGMPFATAEDPPAHVLDRPDRELGQINLVPNSGIVPGSGSTATAVLVSVFQRLDSYGLFPFEARRADATWTSGMTVAELTTALLNDGLMSLSHLWLGGEQFAEVLDEAIASAGQRLYDQIAQQTAGHAVTEREPTT